jgi:hypothetical protein
MNGLALVKPMRPASSEESSDSDLDAVYGRLTRTLDDAIRELDPRRRRAVFAWLRSHVSTRIECLDFDPRGGPKMVA